MSETLTFALKSALSAMHVVGAHAAYRSLRPARGIVFMMHRVKPDTEPDFAPNRILSVTPGFLGAVIQETRAAGFELVSLDEACRRLEQPLGEGRHEAVAPFAVLTFDDGYRDNIVHALPVLERHRAPATIYIPTSYVDGQGDYWWLTLEETIRRLDRVDLTIGRKTFDLPTRTTAEKYFAFKKVYWALRAIDETKARVHVKALAHEARFDPSTLSRDLPMQWDDVRALSKNPLITLGAHTVNHFAVSRLSAEAARREMADSIARLEAETGQACRHFSYPYGDETSAGPRDFDIARGLGLRSAVTTQKGLLPVGDRSLDMMALKRLSLNGDYQRKSYLRVLMSGLPFALMNMVRGISGSVGPAAPVQGRVAASTR